LRGVCLARQGDPRPGCPKTLTPKPLPLPPHTPFTLHPSPQQSSQLPAAPPAPVFPGAPAPPDHLGAPDAASPTLDLLSDGAGSPPPSPRAPPLHAAALRAASGPRAAAAGPGVEGAPSDPGASMSGASGAGGAGGADGSTAATRGSNVPSEAEGLLLAPPNAAPGAGAQQPGLPRRPTPIPPLAPPSPSHGTPRAPPARAAGPAVGRGVEAAEEEKAGPGASAGPSPLAAAAMAPAEALGAQPAALPGAAGGEVRHGFELPRPCAAASEMPLGGGGAAAPAAAAAPPAGAAKGAGGKEGAGAGARRLRAEGEAEQQAEEGEGPLASGKGRASALAAIRQELERRGARQPRLHGKKAAPPRAGPTVAFAGEEEEGAGGAPERGPSGPLEPPVEA
jgi:hypothetical protein